MCNINNDTVFFIDIDGTIKDLVKENTDALMRTMAKMGSVDKKLRGKAVFSINKANMYLVKTGLLPTNSIMQKILLFIYSTLLFKSYTRFKEIYFDEYNKEHIFFDSAEKDIEKVCCNNAERVYFVTKNSQNRSIIKSQLLKSYDKEFCIVVGYKNLVTWELLYKNKKVSSNYGEYYKSTKYAMFKHMIMWWEHDKEKIVVIGDNLFDDVIPALRLGVKVVWCNKYNCKLKKVVAKILTKFCKNLSYN